LHKNKELEQGIGLTGGVRKASVEDGPLGGRIEAETIEMDPSVLRFPGGRHPLQSRLSVDVTPTSTLASHRE